jgi:hypothetical protein
LDDYAIELIDSEESGDSLPSGFFSDDHKNESSAEYYTYYLDYDRLADVKGGKLGFRITSAGDSPLVAYGEAMFLTTVQNFVGPNMTTEVDVIMRRRLNKAMFQLTEDFSEQKITGKPGPDWIE